MIAKILGILEHVSSGSVLVNTQSGMWYEVLVPACDVERLRMRIGQEIALFTIHYLEGDPSHGSQTPRLVGFMNDNDRVFFRLFTTVKGIGNRKALRALAKPVGEIASAIAAKDARYLTQLPEIGKRTAEQIIAELNGKVEPFAGPAAPAATPLSEAANEAVSVLVQLGEKRADALTFVDRVLAVAPEIDSPEEIIKQVYKLKGH